MAINFANENFVQIFCDKIHNDHHPIQNLVSNEPNLRRNGFLLEYFMRPPVIITINFSKYNLNLKYLELGLRLRSHKTNGIEIYFSRCSNCTHGRCDGLIGKFYRINPDVLTIVNDRYMPGSSLPDPPKNLPHNSYHIPEKKLRYCHNIKTMKIKITSTQNSSVPCLSFINLYGQPFNMKGGDLSEVLKFANVTKEKSLLADTLEPPKLDNLAPPEFFDSLTCEMMNRPYLLPSGKNIDKTTLDRYLNGRSLSESVDPFTRVTFDDLNKPKINEDLKSRIDLFISTNGQSEVDRREEIRRKLLNN